MISELQKYRRIKNMYSQNGEDGVIRELLNRLAISKGWFCEFGAGDGKCGSNTYQLLKQGWSGVMIECDPVKFRVLKRTSKKFPNKLYPICRTVNHEEGLNTLDAILADAPIPKEFEILSIDVDGFDYQIWKGFKNYRPLIVIIEINSSILPGIEQIHQNNNQGTSFTSMLHLGMTKGYNLVCHTGNMIFIRNDLIDKIGLPSNEIENPDILFTDEWIDRTFLQGLRRAFHYLTIQRVVAKTEYLILS
jgi:hypothetical protein